MNVHYPDFTLSAGPVTVSAKTRAALGAPVLYHYDPEFLELFRRVQDKMATLFRTRNNVIVMQGEAIVALEGAARSLTGPGAKVLNLVQGVFGKGMGYWLKSFGADVTEIEVPYDDAIDPADVEAALRANPGIELVTAVHSETPSGTVTDMSAIGPMAHRHGALTLVDAVSSIGGLEFAADDWCIDVVVTGAQKCLGGPAGVAPVAVSPAAWEKMAANTAAPRDSYLSLLDWREKWLEAGAFPYTPSVSDMFGLEAACDALLAEGLESAISRHSAAARVVRTGVTAMGLQLWARSTANMADCVTAVRLPDEIDHLQVRSVARERYRVMLSSGQGAGNLIRIAHMGPTAGGMHSIVSLATVGRTLRDLGMEPDIGAGLDAALGELASQAVAS